MSPALRRIGAACAALVASAVIAVPAAADEFGLYNADGISGPIPDNFTHHYCFTGSGWTTAWRNVVNGRMANLDAQTGYSDVLQPACDPLIDIRFQLDSTIAGGGSYDCTAFNTGDDGIDNTGDEECETALVKLNPALLDTTHERAKSACHEIGHSVGMAHGNNIASFYNDCMLSGEPPDGTDYEKYNDHHVWHANRRVKEVS